MTWEVCYSQEFESWFDGLEDEPRSKVLASIELLAEIGPHLGRPTVDSVYGSKVSNMKELRTNHVNQLFRVFFAFDSDRRAILLVGGDKKGQNSKRWYRKMISDAEKVWNSVNGEE